MSTKEKIIEQAKDLQAYLSDDVKTAVSYYAKVLDSTIIKQQIEVFRK